MVDRDLAELYQVPTKAMNQAVKRNRERFPAGFAFRLTREEMKELVTGCDRFYSLKHAAAAPTVFTDYGVAMLSGVLRSKRAVEINIQIMRTFVRLRQFALTHEDLARKLVKIERRIKTHDGQIRGIFDALHELIRPPERPRPAIGFRP